jgi:hypothetical protein
MISKTKWDPAKSISYEACLENHLSHHPQDTICLTDLCTKVFSSLGDSGLQRQVQLGDSSCSQGPRWFDQKCLRYKTKCRSALRDFRMSRGYESENISRIVYVEAKGARTNLLIAKKEEICCNSM